jgi:nitrosocyanin
MKMILMSLMLVASAGVFAQAKRSITLVNYETDGVKQWLPGTIIAKKGETVEITLINNVPSGDHGFMIPSFKVMEVVKKGVKKVVTFKAENGGLYEMKCHMHPAHVGGQLLIVP